MTAPDPAWQAVKLREAAEFITGCAELQLPMHNAAGRTIAAVTPALAKPLAAILLGAALQIEAAGTTAGLSVRNALEIAGLVLHVDLGHATQPSDPPRGTP